MSCRYIFSPEGRNLPEVIDNWRQGFQNIIYESSHFPQELLNEINSNLMEKYSGERKKEDTDEQFIYKTRKKAFGDFKKQMWDLPEHTLSAIGNELEDRFTLIFDKLNVINSMDLVAKYVVNTPINMA